MKKGLQTMIDLAKTSSLELETLAIRIKGVDYIIGSFIGFQ
jgi:hypothetical protein